MNANTDFADETATLIDDIADVLRRYIIFDNEHDALILATQVLYTYIWDGNFYSVLYVYIVGKKGSGKTRLLELIDTLIPNSSGIGVRWTEPTLFREAHAKRTILFDEVHNSMGGPEEKGITSVFNAGNKFGAKVPRVDPKTGENIYWSVFCPKWFAGQDVTHTLLPDTVERTVIIQLPYRPKASTELKTRFFPTEFREDVGKELRERCEQWAEHAAGQIPLMSSIIVPDEIDDRIAEAWLPIFAIADMGKRHSEQIRLAAIDKTVSEEFVTGDTFDVAVKTAMHRGFVSATRYENKNEPPVIGDLTPSDFGWKSKNYQQYERIFATAFKRASVSRSYSKSKKREVIQLKMTRDDYPVFWQSVIRANPGIELPTADEMIRQLKQSGRLAINGPKHASLKTRVWENDSDQIACIVIDITGWFTTLDTVLIPPKTNPVIEQIERILNAKTEDELWGSMETPWKE